MTTSLRERTEFAPPASSEEPAVNTGEPQAEQNLARRFLARFALDANRRHLRLAGTFDGAQLTATARRLDYRLTHTPFRLI
jgi:hypothetical protein